MNNFMPTNDSLDNNEQIHVNTVSTKTSLKNYKIWIEYDLNTTKYELNMKWVDWISNQKSSIKEEVLNLMFFNSLILPDI